MLVGTVTPQLKEQAANILYNEIGLHPSINQQAIMWVDPDENKVKWIAGYDSFVGKMCQMHAVNLGLQGTPRNLLWAAFDYPFNRLGLKTVTVVIDSDNKRSLRYVKKLGFKEVCRFEGCHDDGGDVVILKMDKAECRWI